MLDRDSQQRHRYLWVLIPVRAPASPPIWQKLKTASPRRSLAPQKAELVDTPKAPRKGRTHWENWQPDELSWASALTRTLPPLMAFHSDPKSNNSNDLFGISGLRISELPVSWIISVLKMEKWGTCPLTQKSRADPNNPDLLSSHLILYSEKSCKQSRFPLPFSPQDVFTFPQWFVSQGIHNGQSRSNAKDQHILFKPLVGVLIVSLMLVFCWSLSQREYLLMWDTAAFPNGLCMMTTLTDYLPA